MTEPHYSNVNQDDANLILSLLDTPKEEDTTDRKQHLHADLEHKVTNSSKDRLHKAECSHIQPKILKRTESES